VFGVAGDLVTICRLSYWLPNDTERNLATMLICQLAIPDGDSFSRGKKAGMREGKNTNFSFQQRSHNRVAMGQ
jgi:hypothetical protein